MNGVESRAESVIGRPAPPLRPLIDRYIGYRLSGFEPGIHRGLPSGHMTFIVSIDRAINVVAHPDESQPPARYGCVIGGLQATPALIDHDGNQEGVAIELNPLGFRALFRTPARALWATSAECSDVAGSVGHELWERLQGTAGWTERFAVCDDVLLRLLDADVPIDPRLAGAWQLLVESRGNAPVAELADAVGWSRQHLRNRFATEFGPSPKLAARVMRFDRARRMLQTTPSFVTIAQVAATCGYYDQAHLTRDFAALAGCSPRAWLAEELPSVQDNDLAELRFSEA